MLQAQEGTRVEAGFRVQMRDFSGLDLRVGCGTRRASCFADHWANSIQNHDLKFVVIIISTVPDRVASDGLLSRCRRWKDAKPVVPIVSSLWPSGWSDVSRPGHYHSTLQSASWQAALVAVEASAGLVLREPRAQVANWFDDQSKCSAVKW